jgi:hypothetical protein
VNTDAQSVIAHPDETPWLHEADVRRHVRDSAAPWDIIRPRAVGRAILADF